MLGLALMLTSCAVPRRQAYLPPLPPSPKKTDIAASPRLAATLPAVVGGGPRPDPARFLTIPPAPNSNRWIVLTFTNQGSHFVVYQRPDLAPTGLWQIVTNVTTNIAILPFDQTIPVTFFATRLGTATNNPLPSTNTVLLDWDLKSNLNYRIYYGPASRRYTNSVQIGATNVGWVRGLMPGGLYFFGVTATDSLGQESDYSNEVLYSAPAGTYPAFTQIKIVPVSSVVSTMPPIGIISTNATLQGQVIDNGGDPPITMFFYGTTDPAVDTNNFWQFIAVSGVSTNANTMSATVKNLKPNTKYFCVFAAKNASGLVIGSEKSFTTSVLMAPRRMLMSPKHQAERIKR